MFSRAGGGWECEPGPPGAGWGPPAVSPELEAALLMDACREDNRGRGRETEVGRGGAGTGDSGFNPFKAWVLGVSRGGP